MQPQKRTKVALVGNPNCGKSSLFNHLTGLNQKVGNFPGVTVEKKTGICRLDATRTVEVIDLPGVYSIYPRSLDEKIVAEVLLDHRSEKRPDVFVVVVDATNLKRGLLLLTQVIDLGLPCLLVLNMIDLASRSGVSYDLEYLSTTLGVQVLAINARQGFGIDHLKTALLAEHQIPSKQIFPIQRDVEASVKELRDQLGVDNDYEAFLFLDQPASIGFLPPNEKAIVDEIRNRHQFFPGKFQGAETIQRYSYIQDLLSKATIRLADPTWKRRSFGLDKILTHKVWGYVIFFGVLFLIFQSIFAWATLPMDLIDALFAQLSQSVHNTLPSGPLSSLLADGVIPGIGGILIFIPQIAILFGLISILEETGYMSRVVFLMDKIMRKFGLNGKSVVPLISGVACAIPAIMSARTIDNWKERTITIFVTPLMSCSARLPVFTILIALVVPAETVWGFFNLQGIALMGLYLLGFLAALVSAAVMKFLINVKERSYLIMELPTYRWPKWSNVGFTIVEKTKAFVFEAGKIILAISIVLWVLASYGPGENFKNARERVLAEANAQHYSEQMLEDRISAYKLEHSYAGVIGKSLEPVIRPLGYDWKIGIALITSFAAREVFVGTMATIYSIGSADEEDVSTIKSRMKEEINPETGGPRFTPAVGFSLLVFYTFAMQCMSTLAIVYRETNGWKWPLLQLTYMTALAYFAALLVYQVLS